MSQNSSSSSSSHEGPSREGPASGRVPDLSTGTRIDTQGKGSDDPAMWVTTNGLYCRATCQSTQCALRTRTKSEFVRSFGLGCFDFTSGRLEGGIRCPECGSNASGFVSHWSVLRCRYRYVVDGVANAWETIPYKKKWRLYPLEDHDVPAQAKTIILEAAASPPLTLPPVQEKVKDRQKTIEGPPAQLLLMPPNKDQDPSASSSSSTGLSGGMASVLLADSSASSSNIGSTTVSAIMNKLGSNKSEAAMPKQTPLAAILDDGKADVSQPKKQKAHAAAAIDAEGPEPKKQKTSSSVLASEATPAPTPPTL